MKRKILSVVIVAIIFALCLTAFSGCAEKSSVEKSSVENSSIENSSTTSLSESSSAKFSTNSLTASSTKTSESKTSSQGKTSETASSSFISSQSTSVKQTDYSVSGQISKNGNSYGINQNFKLTFNKKNISFNKISFSYKSTEPLVCNAYYGGTSAISDCFYLEKGNKTFSILLKNFNENIKYSEMNSISFSTAQNKVATLEVSDFYFSVANLPSSTDNVTYLENDYLKVGVKLIWGGGICYVKDKSFVAVDNLINQADTGRLVQQSYYGTNGSSQYTAGEYNGTKWCYNPVQGGDLKNNHSRLIDVSVKENEIYVKSQPLDWAKDNALTPTYMENVYTLEKNIIKVKNSFVDFSGYTHRYAHQELPAFYTVSYLDSFSYYDGGSPWTNATVKTESSLPFWGDASAVKQCYHYVRKSNTETWCAWTNSQRNYGIGLFTPNVDCLLAGRHCYNGSTNSLDGACSYVAPLKTIMLKSYEPISYDYMLTTGSLQKIRQTFVENKNFATNSDLDLNSQSMRVSG